MTRPLLLTLLAALLALGCRSPEEKLADRRRDLRDALDELHAEYAGAAPASEARDGGAAEGSGGVVGRIVKELGRAHFDESCLAVGRGERPLVLSDRLAAFLEDPDHSRGCRAAARLEAEVAALERDVQGRR